MPYAVHKVDVRPGFKVGNLVRQEHIEREQYRRINAVLKATKHVVEGVDSQSALFIENGRDFEIIMVMLDHVHPLPIDPHFMETRHGLPQQDQSGVPLGNHSFRGDHQAFAPDVPVEAERFEHRR